MKNLLSIEESSIRFHSFIKENHLGKSNAIKARELKAWGDPRTIRFLVNTLRKKGVPICSGNSGYWYASKPSEIDEITNKLKSHIKDLTEVCVGLDDAMYEMNITMGVE